LATLARVMIGLAAAVVLRAADGRALLEQRCAGCHNATARKSGLDVTSRAALLRGGDRGPAIDAANPRASLLYKAITHGAKPHMPLGLPKLSVDEIAAVEAWIAGPVDAVPALAVSVSKHWAFAAPVRPKLPEVSDAEWRRNPVDAFVMAQLNAKGLTPLARANPRTLLRRVYLDLTGVPPTPAELQAFLADPSPAAYERTVDRLLASTRYGERWGRHWMDIWRYSDWYGWRAGKDVRNSARHLWRWRDWIVESLNHDKGYDRMVMEMLAGDELAPDDPDTVRATGYLARSFSKYDRHGWMQDAVDHTAMAFLGVTLKCARCHDHKYDPFTQKEYFQFRAFFEPYQVRTDRVPGETDIDKNGVSRVYDAEPQAQTFLLVRGDVQSPDKEHPLEAAVPRWFGAALPPVAPVSLPLAAYYPDHRGFVHRDLVKRGREAVEQAEKSLAEARTKLAAEPGRKNEDAVTAAEKGLAAARAELPALEARIEADKARHLEPPAPGADELSEKARRMEREAGILRADENLFRANLELAEALATREAGKPFDEKKVGAAQKRVDAARTALTREAEGYTPVGKVYGTLSSGRRLALARWITGARNPLAARVAVNHIWLRHFGRALVPTVFDFGMNGRPASHPELLDWLATELMSSGWSMKHIHRLLVTSRSYQSASSTGVEGHPNASVDPENIHLWRMNARRMEAEAVRDSVLEVAGELDPAMGGEEIDAGKAAESRRRSIYLQHTPDVPVPFLKAFDGANPAECYERTESVVPHQALAMANSPASRTMAARLASRLQEPDSGAFIDAAFEAVLGRPATQEETEAGRRFLHAQAELHAAKPEAGLRARENFVHVLFNHNDFVTIR